MIIGKFSNFFFRYAEMQSVQLLESIVRRIFYRFWKTFFQSASIFSGKLISAINSVQEV